jgi:hypothetical protein
MKTHVIAPSCKKLFYFLMVLGIVAFTSCKKETAGGSEEAMTSDEAAEAMSQSVTSEDDGIAAYLEASATANASGSDSSYIVNETFVRSGKFVSKLRRKLIFTRHTTMKAIRVVINHVTKKIVSGTIEFVIKGTNSAGSTFYYTGTFTFHGNSSGTLVLQNGQTFNFQW